MNKKELLLDLFKIVFIGIVFAAGYSLNTAIQEAETIDAIDLIYQETKSKYNDLSSGNWSHTNADGCDFGCRIQEMIPYEWYGENLYRGVCDIQEAVEGWQNSPTHKDILEREYTSGIIYMQKAEDGKCYIIMNVAK